MQIAKTLRLDFNGQTYRYPGGLVLPEYSVDVYPLPNGDNLFIAHWADLKIGQPRPAPSLGQPQHLSLHHVTLEAADGTALKTWDIPNHFRHAEAEYFVPDAALLLGRFKLLRTPKQIVDDGFMVPFASASKAMATIGVSRIDSPPDEIFTAPMDNSFEVDYEPTTGEREEISLTNGQAAKFMVTGNPIGMLGAGLCSAGWPLHFRDETTRKPVNLTTPGYGTANVYGEGQQGEPFIVRGPFEKDSAGNPWFTYGGGFTPQQAHHLQHCFIAYLATGDLGFLRRICYNANFVLMTDAYNSQPNKAILSGEMRGYFWGMRDLFMAYIACKEAEARGINLAALNLHGSDYFKTLLINQRDQQLNVLMKDPLVKAWGTSPAAARPGPWQADYGGIVLGWAISTDEFDDWIEVYLSNLANQVIRLEGGNGWSPGVGTPYYFSVQKGAAILTPAEAFDGMVGDPDAQLSQADHDRLLTDPLNGAQGGRPLMGAGYFEDTRAVMAVADYVDKKKGGIVRARFPKFDTALDNAERMFQTLGAVGARHAFARDTSGSVAIIPPINTGIDNLPNLPPMPTTPLIVPADTTLMDFRALTDRVVIPITPQPGFENRVIRVLGNGRTQVWLSGWENAGYLKLGSDKIPNVNGVKADGGMVFTEVHASGDFVELYNCSGLFIGDGKSPGSTVWNAAPDAPPSDVSPVDGTPQTPPEPAPGDTTPPVTQPPATGGTMAKFLQGVSYLLTPKWDGAIYGAPVWALDKTDQLKLEVAQDGKSAKLTPNVDNTSEDFTVTVKAQNDPDKADSFAVITLKGTDVLRGATTAGSTMDVAVAPAA